MLNASISRELDRLTTENARLKKELAAAQAELEQLRLEIQELIRESRKEESRVAELEAELEEDFSDFEDVRERHRQTAETILQILDRREWVIVSAPSQSVMWDVDIREMINLLKSIR